MKRGKQGQQQSPAVLGEERHEHVHGDSSKVVQVGRGTGKEGPRDSSEGT